MNSTQLREEYVTRTKTFFELPDEIDVAIENDYGVNTDVYTSELLKKYRS